MKKQVTSEEFFKDGDLRQRCKRIVESDDFQALLRIAYSRLGPYRLSYNIDEASHVQDRIDGGRAAVFAFVKELMTLPYKEISFDDDEDDHFINPLDALKSTLV